MGSLDEDDKDRINKNIKVQLKKIYVVENIKNFCSNKKKVLINFRTTLDEINLQLNNRVDTSDLNLYFRELWVANPPHPFRGRRAKLKYVTQYDTEPPSFSFNLSSRIPKKLYFIY